MVVRGTDSARRGGMRGGRGRYIAKKKVCRFCVDKVTEINYKDSGKLSRYITDRGKIEPRRRTGTCARHQRALAEAIKKARHIALIPFVPKHVYATGGAEPMGLMAKRMVKDIKAGAKIEMKQPSARAAATEIEVVPAKIETVKSEVVKSKEVKAEKTETPAEEKETKKRPAAKKKEKEAEEEKKES